MSVLYPEIEPFASFKLPTESVHKIYVEQVGNEHGVPVVFLHGGPGSGCNENHRRYFNPAKYRIILFDQRGCHRSEPCGNTEANTTQDLLKDLEAIRQKLEIDQWVLFGGSWGATLALLYAEAFPERVRGMIIRGAFLARKQDLDWFVGGGSERIFPDYWEHFTSQFSGLTRAQLLKAVPRLLSSGNPSEKLAAAKAWAEWAGQVTTYTLENKDGPVVEQDETKLLHDVSIEMHYASNQYFILENQILEHIDLVPEVPMTIVHGRRDLTCLVEASWLLHKALPNSKLLILPNAGHLAGEPAMVDALVTATDEMLLQLEEQGSS